MNPGNEFDLNQGVGGGRGGEGLHFGFLKARFRVLLVGRRTRSRLMASLVCPVQGIGQLLLTVHRLQKVRIFVYSSSVRTNSKPKGLERGGKRRARLGRDAKTEGWFLFSRLTTPHAPLSARETLRPR